METTGRARTWYDEGYWAPGGTKSMFSGIWEDQQDPFMVQDAKNRAGLITRLLPEGRLLDVGCGTGHIVHALRALGRDSFGTDWSHSGVIRRWTPYVVEAVAGDLPFRAGSFGGVSSWDFLEHIPTATIPKIIRDLARCGRWQFHAISASLNADLGDVSWMRGQDQSHCSFFSERWWGRAFRMAAPERRWVTTTFPAMTYGDYLLGGVLVWSGEEGPALELLTRYAEAWRRVYNQRQVQPDLVVAWPPGLD